MSTRPTVLVAHPSADRYGSDLQLLETVQAFVEEGVRVVVSVPADGPLVPELQRHGAEILRLEFPVLRKSALRPRGLARLLRDVATSLPRLRRAVRRVRPALVLVNTITIPWWLAAARLARVPTTCHVHEAEQDGPRLVRTLLAAPNLLATRLVVNSASSATALAEVVPLLRRRMQVVHNGVPGPSAPPSPPRPRRADDPLSVVVVGRLSPRKGIDVALEAVALVHRAGLDVTLDVYGTAFEGYEWFEAELRERAGAPDLRRRVSFHGYVNPVWPALAGADVVLVPSRVEPFGNAAVEALLARRPLVASRTQGLAEIVKDGVTGLHADPGSAESLAARILDLARDPALAATLADAGHADALERFAIDRYRRQLRAAAGFAQPDGQARPPA